MEKFDTFLIFWSEWIFLPSFFLGFFGVILFILKDSDLLKIIKNKKGIGLILISKFLLILFITYSSRNYFEKKVKSELINMLDKNNLEIEIKGKKLNTDETIEISNELKREVKGIGEITRNHPHFLKKIEFSLKSNSKKLNLTIEQNNDKKTEFIILSDRYKYTKLNPFAGMKSEIFENYFENY